MRFEAANEREVQAERNDTILRQPPDPEFKRDLIALLRGQNQEGLGPGSENPLGDTDQHLLGRREIAAKPIPVVRVDDGSEVPRRRQDSSETHEKSRLRQMDVDQIGTQLSDEPAQTP